MYSKYNFCKYSVLDNWEPFDGELEDGHYYIETDDYGLFHKNGIYSRPIVEYGLEIGIITLENIKQQFKPSSVIDNKYFQNFINYLIEIFKPSGQEKIAVNAWIGILGRRNSSYIQQEYTSKNDVSKTAEIYGKFNNPYINELDGNILSITNLRRSKKLETNFYIHSQIVDIEAVELYKLLTKIKEIGAVPICVKTDCVIFNSDKPLDISNEYWAPGVLKYKYEEDPSLLKNEMKIFNEDSLTFENSNYQNYNEDVKIDEIIEKGCLILGPAGVGKSYKIKQICNKLDELEKKYIKLAPTNKAARIIGGETLDKYCAKILKSNKSINKFKNLDYIFVDEVSMVRELFYQVLIMVKHSNPKIKFIISGDFYQLDVVKDRITNRSYENSRVLFELVDGMKLNLTECKRASAELFNICEAVKHGKEIDISQFDKKKSFINICYTNEMRKKINNERMADHLKNRGQTLKIEKLRYDKNSQDFTLMKGMPLIARRNKKELNIFNNERFICEFIRKDKIIIKNDNGDKIDININEINKLFYLGFCFTTHRAQGETIDTNYTIYEWDKMDTKLRYVALSRATNKKYINIV